MKILIIEDDINLASTLARRLTKYGFNCEIAHNQSEALLSARRFLPATILLDMKLGSDNGLALIKPLRSLLTHAH
ncbi:response regulator, partial [Salmonella enterica]|nr:response regulator [Salmonella enterica]